MFLLLRKAGHEETEVVNVSAIQTAHSTKYRINGKELEGTTVVWHTDDRYLKESQFSNHRETIYDISFDDFIAKIAEAGEMYWL